MRVKDLSQAESKAASVFLCEPSSETELLKLCLELSHVFAAECFAPCFVLLLLKLVVLLGLFLSSLL